MSRWSDILLARRRSESEGESPEAWGIWHHAASCAGLRFRLRRTLIGKDRGREFYSWEYEFRSEFPEPVNFEYRVRASPDGPFDLQARRIESDQVVKGSVIMQTGGPIWVDARLLMG